MNKFDPDGLYHLDVHLVCDEAAPYEELPRCPDCGREKSGAVTLVDQSVPDRPRVIDLNPACIYCAMEDSS